MKVLDILLESSQKFYAIGDSHAEGIANYGGKNWVSLAHRGTPSTDARHKQEITNIPKGSVVAVCLGCNDGGNEARRKMESGKARTPDQVAQSVKSVVDAVNASGSKAVPVLYPPSTKPPYYGSLYSQEIRNAIKSALPGAIDMDGSKLYDGVHASAADYINVARKIEKLGGATSGSGQEPAPTTQKPTPSVQPSTGEFKVPTPEGNSLGHAGPGIMDVQKALVAMKYDVGPPGIDGIRGKYTIAAIKKYQTDRGLEVDGDPGPETVAALNADIAKTPALFKGLTNSKPGDVKVRTLNVDANGVLKLDDLPQDAVTKGKIGQVLNFIAKPESGGYYDIMMGGGRHPEILDMTINQLLNYQANWPRKTKRHTPAAGRYQYMPDTLRRHSKMMGANLETDKFTPEFQDKLATFTMRYQCRLDGWLKGQVKDEEFLDLLSHVWAGIPTSKTGQSYYNDGFNKAGVSANYALNTLQNIRSA